MDIAASSRPFFAMPSPTPEEKISLQASNTVYTYHCLCSHLLLATTTPLPSLPKRHHSHDKAHIMPLPPAPTPNSQKNARAAPQSAHSDHYGLLLSTRIEKTAEIITSDEGFEKRYLQRCGRCSLVVGYQLDWQQFAVDRTGRREDFVFLLPGGFMTTSEMIVRKAGKTGGGMATMSVTEVKV
jgi:hypothetical protein